MARSLDDIITTAQQIVQAITGLSETWRKIAGTITSLTVDDTVEILVVVGTGRLVNVSVVDGGSGDGLIFNSSTITSLPSIDQLAIIPQTVGVYPLNVLYTNGLVIQAGTGQLLNITYSPDT